MYFDLVYYSIPGGAVVKNLSANAGNAGAPGSVFSRRSPGEGNDNPLVFLLVKSHGQRGLAGYSPWDHKQSDMT